MSTTSIKHAFTSIILAFTLITCNSPAHISGTIEGTNKKDTKIYLLQPEFLRDIAGSYYGQVIDSAIINSDGQFEFTHMPITKDPVLLEIAVQPHVNLPNYLDTDNPNYSNYMPILWQFGESIEVSAKFDEFQKSFSIKNPSEINKSLLDLRDIHQQAYRSYLHEKHWKIDGGEQLLEKEHAILQFQKELIKFANSTPHLVPALVALRWVSPINDYERVPEFLVSQCNKWNEIQPEHPWVQQLCYQSQPSNLPVLIGSAFPNIKLPLVTKDTLYLNDQLGNKLTIVDIWASWCAPCRVENREILVPIWEEYHSKGVQIIGFSLEGNAASWQTAAEKDGANRWLQASELEGDDTPMLRKIRVRTIPANFILDENGVVLAKNIHGTALIDWVKNYLK